MFGSVTLRATAVAAFIASGFPALAEFPEPVGEVILTIDGAVDAPSPDGWSLDLAAIQSLPLENFETTTIWTDGPIKFTGVSLMELLKAAGADGQIVVAEALNGYAVEIPISDLEEVYPIVAFHMNDEEFSRRDKGPLWVVYPYDLDPKYKTEVTFAYSIWQLQRLTVK